MTAACRRWPTRRAAQALTYYYNPMSQVSKIIYGSGSTPDVQSYGYNSLHQLTSDTLSAGTTASPTVVASIGYQYDSDGNITQKATTNLGGTGTTTNDYTYDEASRLISWNNGTTTTAYGYDSDGNRTRAGSVSYTYDARDELTGDGTSSYSYTANGDLSSTVTGSSGTVDLYHRRVRPAGRPGHPVRHLRCPGPRRPAHQRQHHDGPVLPGHQRAAHQRRQRPLHLGP